MKCLVVVNSKGGNTRMVANALVDALEKAGSEVVFVDDPAAVDRASVDAAEAVLAGFWTDKGDCAPEMATFLERLSGKRVFLFGTAGFGGSPEYFERILGNVQKHLPADDTVYDLPNEKPNGCRKQQPQTFLDNRFVFRIRRHTRNHRPAVCRPRTVRTPPKARSSFRSQRFSFRCRLRTRCCSAELPVLRQRLSE